MMRSDPPDVTGDLAQARDHLASALAIMERADETLLLALLAQVIDVLDRRSSPHG